jgi:hypothetical protein
MPGLNGSPDQTPFSGKRWADHRLIHKIAELLKNPTQRTVSYLKECLLIIASASIQVVFPVEALAS